MKRQILGSAASVILALVVQPLVAAAKTNVIYFLAEERSEFNTYKDSFVLPLTLPEHIEHARRHVDDPNLEDRRIPVARVVRGADDINRNYDAADKRPWTWHITEFLSFSDAVPGTPASTAPQRVETNSVLASS